jgi:uncharacterized protein
MIKVNVSQLLKSPIGTKRNCPVDDTVNIAGSDRPVQGEIDLMNTDRSILAEGQLHSESELTCSRCLTLFRYPLTLDIEEEYFPTIDLVTGAHLSLPDEPGAFIIDEHNILDFTEAIRQYALLAVPIKPLCRQDCAGLCPVCGCNLNQTSCQCPPKSADPRWAELGKLVSVDNRPLKKE